MKGKSVAMLLFAGILFLTGFATGVRFYYLLALILACVLGYAFVSVVWTLATFRAKIHTDTRRVERGKKCPIICAVSHSSILPAGRISLAVGSSRIKISQMPFAKKNYRASLSCPHRGVYSVGVSTVTARDAFGLFCLSRKLNAGREIIEVLPKAYEVMPIPLKNIDMGPQAQAPRIEDAQSPADLRAWQYGDSLKKVHWKLSARKMELVVRTFEENARPDTLIIPDMARYDDEDEERLNREDRVCEACLSYARAQLIAGNPVRLALFSAKPNELFARHASEEPRFAEALARAAFDAPNGFEYALIKTAGRLGRTGCVVVVTPELTDRVADITLRLRKTGTSIRFIWITDALDKDDARRMLIERMKMAGVEVEER